MAVVKLGRPVKSNLGGDNGAMAYIINPAKTDGGRLVSSNYERTRTDYDALAEGMLDDNRRSPKGIRKDSRLAYHIKLSFSPKDPVTPEQVHELGVEFARRITGGEYKFVVATHTDRHHLHDHIMVCAASRYGKHLKAELPKDIIDQWRAVSDEICRREDLRVVFNPVVEEQARKMRGSETTTDDAPTTRERDPERIDETAGPGAATPPRTTRRAEGEEPVERRKRGKRSAELPAQLPPRVQEAAVLHEKTDVFGAACAHLHHRSRPHGEAVQHDLRLRPEAGDQLVEPSQTVLALIEVEADHAALALPVRRVIAAEEIEAS